MERKQLAECDIPPSAGCTLEQASDVGSIRRYVWKSGQLTLPGEIEIDVTAYEGPNSSTGFLISVYEAPATIEGMS